MKKLTGVPEHPELIRPELTVLLGEFLDYDRLAKLSLDKEWAKRSPKERKEFGPSKWFSVDVGREGKAEARWLLPMICKAGDITKKPDRTLLQFDIRQIDRGVLGNHPRRLVRRTLKDRVDRRLCAPKT